MAKQKILWIVVKEQPDEDLDAEIILVTDNLDLACRSVEGTPEVSAVDGEVETEFTSQVSEKVGRFEVRTFFTIKRMVLNQKVEV